MDRRTTPTVWVWRGLMAVMAGLLISGCTVPRAEVEPSGRLPVLGPVPGFSLNPLPKDWLITGQESPDGRFLKVVERQGIPALKVSGFADGFVLARRTRTVLLTSPYLSWSWSMVQHGEGAHPIGLIIGFQGGVPESTLWGGPSFVWPGTALPPHDRVLKLVWGHSALARGSLVRAPGKAGKNARYTVRGGRENAGSWWLETVDLANLYRRSWPGDDMGRVRIVFIGVGAGRTQKTVTGYFSGIVLSR